MFSLYLSTPLARPSYLFAKVLAVMSTMALVVVGPPVLFLIGYTFQSQGPEGLFDWVSVMGRILLAGVVICVVYTAISLGVSSLTDRRAFASIAVVFVMLGASIAAGVLVDVAGFSENWRILDPISGTLEIAPRLFGDRSEEFRNISTWLVVLGSAAWTVFGSALLIGRYRRLAAV